MNSRMRVHVLQHVPFEGLGSIEAWLQQRDATVSYSRFFEGEYLPPVEAVDFIIALGGPMSVNDEDQFPWLRDEKHFIAQAIEAGKSVLGICLGAQLIAAALGASVYRNQEKEIGWFPIHAETGTPTSFRFPPSVQVFHWHGETFSLPAGAVHLASSAACRHQAFQIGTKTIALQFHLETTPDSVEAILLNCPRDLVAREFVQSKAQLRSTSAAAYQGIHALMDQILTYLTRNIRRK